MSLWPVFTREQEGGGSDGGGHLYITQSLRYLNADAVRLWGYGTAKLASEETPLDCKDTRSA